MDDILQEQIASTELLLRKALEEQAALRKTGLSSIDRQAIQNAVKAVQRPKALPSALKVKARPAVQTKGTKRDSSQVRASPPPAKKQKPTQGMDHVDQVEAPVDSPKKHAKEKKKKQGGGAAPPRMCEFPTPQEVAHVVEQLVPLDPSPLLTEKYTLYRQNEIWMPKPEGRSCCFDAFSAATGAKLSRARVKKHRAGKETDLVPENCMKTFKPNPFRLVKKDCTWRHLIEECKEGIYIVRFSFMDFVTQKIDKHFIAVDCWRSLIMDDGEARPIPFLGRTGKQMMKRLQGASLERVWTVFVASHLVHLTHYV